MSHAIASADDPLSAKIYNHVFWIAFAANVLLVCANTLTFRFAEFVKFLGGSEETTGLIVSVGLIASLVWRAFLGQALDRFGVRRVWVSSIIFYFIGCLLILTAQQVHWQLYLGRSLFVIALASMFTSSLSHIQELAPPARRTEMVATFGTSGFLGMVIGAQLGDVIFLSMPESRKVYLTLFGLTLLMGLVHVALAYWMTSGIVHTRPSETPAVHRLLIRYWSPLVLIATLMVGLGFAVTTVFLTRYATSLGLGGIRTYFTAYAISACLVRILARKWSRTTSRHKLIVMGLTSHAIGFWGLSLVTRDWHFIPPAICCGFGHAVIFPCAISLGAGAFPEQYRGTATSVTLACMDIGTICSAPILGLIIDTVGFHPMLYVVCITFAVSAVAYFLMTSRLIDSDVIRETAPASVPLVENVLDSASQQVTEEAERPGSRQTTRANR